MNTASYTSVTTATGGVGKYPLSTETLDFIQTQISLLERLAGIGGKNYILQAKGGGGAVVITPKGGVTEVLELMQKPAFTPSVKYVTVITETEDIKADDETYLEARIYRRAQFTTAKGTESYDINDFANVSDKALGPFPSNAYLAEQIKSLPATVLEYLKDTLVQKLTSKPLKGVTKEQIDGLRTACVLSCSESAALFGTADYTLIVTEQGSKVRQELIQGNDQRYVRTGNSTSWGAWEHRTETAMHLDVKIVGTTVYVRHGAIGEDCSLVLLRKKKRSAWRATGGPLAYSKNKGIRKKRAAKTQYVYFKGIRLSKGTPGKWYVPKCVEVADSAVDGNLIGKELPGLCASLFRVGAGGSYRIQGVRKKIVLKNTPNKKGTQHSGYAPIGLQIARLNVAGGKDSGGEIVRMKYRISQYVTATKPGTNGKPIPIAWGFKRSFSMA